MLQRTKIKNNFRWAGTPELHYTFLPIAVYTYGSACINSSPSFAVDTAYTKSKSKHFAIAELIYAEVGLKLA